MAKKASKSVQRNNAHMRITVYYGYALFLFVMIGVLWTLVPWVTFIASSQSTSMINDFVGPVLLLCFVFTALAPSLVGYLTGDSATRSKSKLVHHFNGVLFGVLGVWLWVLLTMVVGYSQQWLPASSMLDPIVYGLAPAVIAALVTIALGVRYARVTKHQVSLIDYKPYQVLVISSAVLLVLVTGAAGAIAAQYGEFFTLMLTYIIVPLLFMLIATSAGYWIIGKAGGDVWERVTRSLVAVGFALLALTIVTQYAGYLSGLRDFLSAYAIVITGGVWLSYLLLMRRALKK